MSSARVLGLYSQLSPPPLAMTGAQANGAASADVPGGGGRQRRMTFRQRRVEEARAAAQAKAVAEAEAQAALEEELMLHARAAAEGVALTGSDAAPAFTTAHDRAASNETSLLRGTYFGTYAKGAAPAYKAPSNRMWGHEVSASGRHKDGGLERGGGRNSASPTHHRSEQHGRDAAAPTTAHDRAVSHETSLKRGTYFGAYSKGAAPAYNAPSAHMWGHDVDSHGRALSAVAEAPEPTNGHGRPHKGKGKAKAKVKKTKKPHRFSQSQAALDAVAGAARAAAAAKFDAAMDAEAASQQADKVAADQGGRPYGGVGGVGGASDDDDAPPPPSSPPPPFRGPPSPASTTPSGWSPAEPLPPPPFSPGPPPASPGYYASPGLPPPPFSPETRQESPARSPPPPPPPPFSLMMAPPPVAAPPRSPDDFLRIQQKFAADGAAGISVEESAREMFLRDQLQHLKAELQAVERVAAQVIAHSDAGGALGGRRVVGGGGSGGGVSPPYQRYAALSAAAERESHERSAKYAAAAAAEAAAHPSARLGVSADVSSPLSAGIAPPQLTSPAAFAAAPGSAAPAPRQAADAQAPPQRHAANAVADGSDKSPYRSPGAYGPGMRPFAREPAPTRRVFPLPNPETVWSPSMHAAALVRSANASSPTLPMRQRVAPRYGASPTASTPARYGQVSLVPSPAPAPAPSSPRRPVRASAAAPATAAGAAATATPGPAPLSPGRRVPPSGSHVGATSSHSALARAVAAPVLRGRGSDSADETAAASATTEPRAAQAPRAPAARDSQAAVAPAPAAAVLVAKPATLLATVASESQSSAMPLVSPDKATGVPHTPPGAQMFVSPLVAMEQAAAAASTAGSHQASAAPAATTASGSTSASRSGGGGGASSGGASGAAASAAGASDTRRSGTWRKGRHSLRAAAAANIAAAADAASAAPAKSDDAANTGAAAAAASASQRGKEVRAANKATAVGSGSLPVVAGEPAAVALDAPAPQPTASAATTSESTGTSTRGHDPRHSRVSHQSASDAFDAHTAAVNAAVEAVARRAALDGMGGEREGADSDADSDAPGNRAAALLTPSMKNVRVEEWPGPGPTAASAAASAARIARFSQGDPHPPPGPPPPSAYVPGQGEPAPPAYDPWLDDATTPGTAASGDAEGASLGDSEKHVSFREDGGDYDNNGGGDGSAGVGGGAAAGAAAAGGGPSAKGLAVDTEAAEAAAAAAEGEAAAAHAAEEEYRRAFIDGLTPQEEETINSYARAGQASFKGAEMWVEPPPGSGREGQWLKAYVNVKTPQHDAPPVLKVKRSSMMGLSKTTLLELPLDRSVLLLVVDEEPEGLQVVLLTDDGSMTVWHLSVPARTLMVGSVVALAHSVDVMPASAFDPDRYGIVSESPYPDAEADGGAALVEEGGAAAYGAGAEHGDEDVDAYYDDDGDVAGDGGLGSGAEDEHDYIDEHVDDGAYADDAYDDEYHSDDDDYDTSYAQPVAGRAEHRV